MLIIFVIRWQDSTIHSWDERSAAHRSAKRRPRLNGLRSCWIVRSQDWRMAEVCSAGRWPVDARGALMLWFYTNAALAVCANSTRRRCLINEETGGWLVCERTDMLERSAICGTRTMWCKHCWSKASRRCLIASVLFQVSEPYNNTGRYRHYRIWASSESKLKATLRKFCGDRIMILNLIVMVCWWWHLTGALHVL